MSDLAYPCPVCGVAAEKPCLMPSKSFHFSRLTPPSPEPSVHTPAPCLRCGVSTSKGIGIDGTTTCPRDPSGGSHQTLNDAMAEEGNPIQVQRAAGAIPPALTLEQRRDVEIVAHAIIEATGMGSGFAQIVATRTLRARWAAERLVRERIHLKVHDAAGACEPYYHRGSATIGPHPGRCWCGQVPIPQPEPVVAMMPVEQVRALVRLLSPEHMTMMAVRRFEAACDATEEERR